MPREQAAQLDTISVAPNWSPVSHELRGLPGCGGGVGHAVCSRRTKRQRASQLSCLRQKLPFRRLLPPSTSVSALSLRGLLPCVAWPRRCPFSGDRAAQLSGVELRGVFSRSRHVLWSGACVAWASGHRVSSASWRRLRSLDLAPSGLGSPSVIPHRFLQKRSLCLGEPFLV